MLARKPLMGVAKLVLGAMLFAQAALALAACDGGQRAPAGVIAAANPMPCCQDDDARSDALAGNANLCLAHCTSDAQSVDTSSLPILAPFAVGALTVLPVPAAADFALRRARSVWHAHAGPPLTVLFQNFRI